MHCQANEVLTVETQREFLITKDNAKDGEIGLSLRQLEVMALVWLPCQQRKWLVTRQWYRGFDASPCG